MSNPHGCVAESFVYRQKDGTCWFNTLMALLFYSRSLRKYIDFDTFDKKQNVAKILSGITELILKSNTRSKHEHIPTAVAMSAPRLETKFKELGIERYVYQPDYETFKKTTTKGDLVNLYQFLKQKIKIFALFASVSRFTQVRPSNSKATELIDCLNKCYGEYCYFPAYKANDGFDFRYYVINMMLALGFDVSKIQVLLADNASGITKLYKMNVDHTKFSIVKYQQMYSISDDQQSQITDKDILIIMYWPVGKNPIVGTNKASPFLTLENGLTERFEFNNKQYVVDSLAINSKVMIETKKGQYFKQVDETHAIAGVTCEDGQRYMHDTGSKRLVKKDWMDVTNTHDWVQYFSKIYEIDNYVTHTYTKKSTNGSQSHVDGLQGIYNLSHDDKMLIYVTDEKNSQSLRHPKL